MSCRRLCACGVHDEHFDLTYQFLGLVLHRQTAPRGFLNQRSVLLGRLIHLYDGLVDLVDAWACSWDAVVILAMISVTRFTELTMFSSVLPD